MQTPVMLRFNYVQCHLCKCHIDTNYAKCHYAECRPAKCRGAFQPSLLFVCLLERGTFQVLYSRVGSLPYPQTLYYAGKA